MAAQIAVILTNKVNDDPTRLCAQLRSWRDRNGWKQAFAAGKLGVKLSTYRRWERGRNEPQTLAREAVLKAIQTTQN